MQNKLESIRARCMAGRPIPRIDVKYLLDLCETQNGISDLSQDLIVANAENKQLKEGVERLREIERWVPVTEQAPPTGAYIFVSDGANIALANTRWLYRNPEGKLYSPARYGDGINVIWWKLYPELPEPPKEPEGVE